MPDACGGRGYLLLHGRHEGDCDGGALLHPQTLSKPRTSSIQAPPLRAPRTAHSSATSCGISHLPHIQNKPAPHIETKARAFHVRAQKEWRCQVHLPASEICSKPGWNPCLSQVRSQLHPKTPSSLCALLQVICWFLTGSVNSSIPGGDDSMFLLLRKHRKIKRSSGSPGAPQWLCVCGSQW